MTGQFSLSQIPKEIQENHPLQCGLKKPKKNVSISRQTKKKTCYSKSQKRPRSYYSTFPDRDLNT